jgi:8-oxo-dGTP pyrophosphatase MutT (NUDIX family)
VLLKVVAYITREADHGGELLIFRHPRHIKTPIQVPQGTAEGGESVLNSLWRELEEETGRSDFTLTGQIAQVPFYADWRDEWQERNVFHLSAPTGTPHTWTYVVTAGHSDKGLCFEFFWLPLTKAKEKLHWSQNQWLHLIEAQAP